MSERSVLASMWPVNLRIIRHVFKMQVCLPTLADKSISYCYYSNHVCWIMHNGQTIWLRQHAIWGPPQFLIVTAPKKAHKGVAFSAWNSAGAPIFSSALEWLPLNKEHCQGAIRTLSREVEVVVATPPGWGIISTGASLSPRFPPPENLESSTEEQTSGNQLLTIICILNM